MLSFYCEGSCTAGHSCYHLLMMSRIIFLLSLSLSLYQSLPRSVRARNVPAPLLKGPTQAQLQAARSDGHHEGLIDQSFGDNEETDYHDHDYDYDYQQPHQHQHHYQADQRQPPLPSWVIPLIALVLY